ncbi:MAG: molybdopterin-dependent oxidoreductase [Coriobacteriia bacterium]|nr:molybdopterin-dependent oxidoreductase [Coriobacteriia bacterium]
MGCDGDIASTCSGCGAYCSLRVSVRDGRVARVDGNPRNLATGGAVCPALRIVVEQQADPDRVTVPLRRTNPVKARGVDPRFEPVSWDDALDEIADRLLDLRAQGIPESVVFCKGRSTGVGDLLFKALPQIYGTPNRVGHSSICNVAEKNALGAMDGTWDTRDYDLDHVQCLLLWGTDPAVGNNQKSVFLSKLRDLRSRVAVRVVSPQRSLTCERLGDACDWVPVVPGTDAALALAMAHVVLTEGLWDRGFVGDFVGAGGVAAGDTPADGAADAAGGAPAPGFQAGVAVEPGAFEQSHVRGLVEWWNQELRWRTPEWAATKCGVPAERIRQLAREFAAAGPAAVSWISPGVAMAPNGQYAAMACHALNGLVGSVGARGGTYAFPKPPLAAMPSVEPYLDDVARAGLAAEPVDRRCRRGAVCAGGGKARSVAQVAGLADAVLTGEPYPVQMMIGCWNNFAFSSPDCGRWERALAAVPFSVHVTTHVSETSHFADLVLPAAHHAFETWGFMKSRGQGRMCVSLQQPCVDAPGQAKGDETELPFLLAQKLAERGFDAPLRYFRECFADPETGVAPADGVELGRNAVKLLTEPLWRELGGWEAFREAGVWCSSPAAVRDPGEPVAPLPTESGCFEFVSGSLRELLRDYAAFHGLDWADALADLGLPTAGDLALMPHWAEPLRLGDAGEYPLVFTQHRAFGSLEGRSANSPLFQRMKAMDPGDEPWDDVVKVHPRTLRNLGLGDGQMVRMTSPVGSIAVRVRAWDGVPPGIACKCYGQGHWAYGHVAALDFEAGVPRGGNANEVLPQVREPISGAVVRHGGFARIRLEPL